MRISDWSSDVCSSDLNGKHAQSTPIGARRPRKQAGLLRINGSARERLSRSAQNIEQRLTVDPRKGRLRRLQRQIRRVELRDRDRQVGVFNRRALVGERDVARRKPVAKAFEPPGRQAERRIAVGDMADRAVQRVERGAERSEEHTSELQSLMRISYAVFCLKKKNTTNSEP